MKINTCTNKHFLRKIKVFIRIRQFLDVYRQSHKKSQLFEKINISHEIQFFFPKLTFLHKN